MKIKLITSMVGKGLTLNPGDVTNRPDAEAQRLIDAGYAVPVKDAEPVETAIDPAEAEVETPEPQPEKKPKSGKKKG